MYIVIVGANNNTKLEKIMATQKNKTEVLREWSEVDANLKQLKNQESELRKEVIELWYPTHKEEGTENIDLGNDYKLSAVFKQNYAFDKDADIDKLHDELISVGEDGVDVAEKLFKVKVELNATVYKKLPPSLQKIVNPYVTIKTGSPSLKIVEPKPEKK